MTGGDVIDAVGGARPDGPGVGQAEVRGSRTGLARWVTTPVVAGLLLLVVYGALSLLCSPAGFLGTDTGGKVATVKVMSERGDFDPDVGYWAAQWDPDARVHGLFYTSHLGDQYTNVTSLPMIIAARPLYDIGGYRATLLLPMLGAVAAAFAARALAERLRPGRGWSAFWIAGLASALVVYALDLWEHTLGVACMAWGVVLLVDAVWRKPTWWRGVLAGLAFGAAASMRTEAFVYVVTTVGIAVAVLAFGSARRVVGALVVGATAVVGFAIAFGANSLLESAVLGEATRSSRASGAASVGLGSLSDRAVEGATTLLSPFPSLDAFGWAVGGIVLVLLVLIARNSRKGSEERIAVAAAALVAVIYVFRFATGVGFVPGLVVTTPFAAVAVAIGWSGGRNRLLLAMGLIPLPLVFGFQFLGGAAPQWAGRYILVSGFILLVVGVANATQMARWARVGFVGLSVAVTAFGVLWLAVRSHEIADVGRSLDARPEAVLISPDGFVPREFGATYGQRKWLASGSDEDLDFAVDVVTRSGEDDFAIVALNGTEPEPQFDGWTQVSTEVEPFIRGNTLRITTYERSGE